MSEFLRTVGISFKLEEIILEAKEELIFVSPYLQFPRQLYERLIEKANAGIRITFVYGKNELTRDQEELLKNIKNIKIFYLDNLHAKCYLNESAAIITSMNLYGFSERNNREMGIYINKNTDEKLYEDAFNEVKSIITVSNPRFMSEKEISLTEHKNHLHNLAGSQENLKDILTIKYPGFEFLFNENNNSISCRNFIQSDVYLELEPRNTYYRVDFRFWHPYKISKEIYDTMYSQKNEIEKSFPPGIVNWGNQMRRIKLDLDNITNDELKNWNEEKINYILNIIETGVNQIINRIPKHLQKSISTNVKQEVTKPSVEIQRIELDESSIYNIYEAFREKYKNLKIKKASTYVFSSDLIPICDIMMDNKFLLKFKKANSKSQELINALDLINLNSFNHHFIRENDTAHDTFFYYSFIPEKLISLEKLIEDYEGFVKIIKGFNIVSYPSWYSKFPN